MLTYADVCIRMLTYADVCLSRHITCFFGRSFVRSGLLRLCFSCCVCRSLGLGCRLRCYLY
jgi:hypothetical protein